MALDSIIAEGTLTGAYTTLFTGKSAYISNIKEIIFTNGTSATIFISLRSNRLGTPIQIWDLQPLLPGWTLRYPEKKAGDFIMEAQDLIEGLGNGALYVLSGIGLKK